MIKVDIKDKKIRITYTIQNYEVEKDHTKGIVSRMAGERPSDVSYEKWSLDTCYPFALKDKHKAQRTSSKTLVMAHVNSIIIMDKIAILS